MTENAIIGVQYIREKTVGPQEEIYPEYTKAVERLEFLIKRMNQFHDDITSVIKMMRKVCTTGAEFSAALDRAAPNLLEESPIPGAFREFFTATASSGETAAHLSQKSALVELKVVLARLSMLDQMTKERAKVALLYNSTKLDLQNPDPLKQTKAHAELKTIEVDLAKRTETLISGINQLWEQRFDLIDLSLQKIVGKIFQFGRTTFRNMTQLERNVETEKLREPFVPMM